MLVKVRSSVFIDTLQLELTAPKGNCLRGSLIDDQGSVCRTIEKDMINDLERVTWTGLNDLPYGRYTLELSHGEDHLRMNLVKRV